MSKSGIRNRSFEGYKIFVAAAFALMVGVAYYWFTRPQGSASYLALLPEFSQVLSQSFAGQWLGWLPTFTHVFAFSLLTYLALGRERLLFACMLWGGINALFELGQALPQELILLLPDLFNFRSFFINGVFDPFDLGACILGAWVVWIFFQQRTLDIDQSGAGKIKDCYLGDSP